MADLSYNQSSIIKSINTLVKSWTNIYSLNTKLTERKNDQLPEYDIYETIISHSDSLKPIPEASARIFFYVPSKSTDMAEMRFHFENETLFQSLNDCMDLTKFDDYVSKAIEYKKEHRQVYFLATDFERTRIADTRIDDLEVKHIVQIPPEERLGITQPDLIATNNRLIYCDRDAILKRNGDLFLNSVGGLINILDPFKTGFITKDELIVYLSIVGINVSKAEFDEKIYVPGAQKVVIEINEIRSLLSEVLMSCLLLYKAKQIYTTKKVDLEQKAKILFKNKYKLILDRFVEFLLPIARNKTLSIQTITINLEKLKDSLFTEEQYNYALKRISELSAFDEDGVYQVYQHIMMSKLPEFVDEATKLSRSSLDIYLLAKLGYGKLSHSTFIEFCNNNSAIKLPKRQQLFIWRLLGFHGFLADSCLDMAAHVCILSYYIEHIIKLNEYFYREVEIPDINNLIDDKKVEGLASLDDCLAYAELNWPHLVVNKDIIESCYKQVQEGQKVQMPLYFSRLEALNKVFDSLFGNFLII